MRSGVSKKQLLATVLFVVVAAGGAFILYRYFYPYGRSHCCITALGFDLLRYADAHGGDFPAGEDTPEASLSLLHREQGTPPNVLRGKTVPLKIVRETLEGEGLLGPDSCGWHYVEGLTTDAPSGTALLWDKVGLSHNGRDLHDGGHEVLFVNGSSRYIPGIEWDRFLRKQQLLVREARDAEGSR
jgi:hypothetical protein